MDKKIRIFGLDYLRGISAFGIMAYHLLKWTIGAFSDGNKMEIIGIYGVSLFYILSGLTLFKVYYIKMKPSLSDLASFYKKRLYRIFPLLWIASLLTIYFFKTPFDSKLFFYNFTGLYSIFSLESSISIGSWSIGNEIVFYLFFPIILYIAKKSNNIFYLFNLLIFAIYIFFAFYILTNKINLSNQWNLYINPFNQLFLFLSGFSIGYFFDKIEISNKVLLLVLFFSIVLFFIIPSYRGEINLVTNFNRIGYTFAIILFTLFFYKFKWNLPSVIHKPLLFTGEISYGIYLLHPICYEISGLMSNIIRLNLFYISETNRVLITILLTYLLSYISYRFIEKPIIKKVH